MLRQKIVALVICAFWLSVATSINVFATKIVQWTIEAAFEQRAPFVLLFSALVVVPFAIISTAAFAVSLLRPRRNTP